MNDSEMRFMQKHITKYLDENQFSHGADDILQAAVDAAEDLLAKRQAKQLLREIRDALR